MGGILWTNKPNNKLQSETYYNKVQSNEFAEGLKTQVQISIGLSEISSGSSYIAYLLASEDEGMKVVGMTNEIKTGFNLSKNTIIQFETLFIIDYFFEKEQKLTIRLHKNSQMFSIDTSLGNLMGSRGQTLSRKISSEDSNNKENLILSANSLKNNNITISLNLSFVSDLYKDDSIFVIIKKSKSIPNEINSLSQDPIFYSVYKSEVKQRVNHCRVDLNPLKIPSSVLCNGDFDNKILIELHSFNFQSKLGEHLTTLNKLLGTASKFTITDLVFSADCKLLNEYTFLDYLRGGLQIALTIGIDFTASNGKINETSSLHYFSPGKPNDYERAIKACGSIVAYYDYDGLFPVYGYGAILQGYGVSHCFPINFNHSNPSIHLIDNVINCYKECLHKVTLNGPTLFAPLINQLINNVKSENNPQVYNILMILTDGMINDMDDTIDALVEASYSPVSVIIIGIGKNDFGNMDILDADENPLVDRFGRKAARDLVQFVPFYKFENNEKLLSSNVLEEIPRQLLEYYNLIKMPPGDPVL
jgi:hypothetical protein